MEHVSCYNTDMTFSEQYGGPWTIDKLNIIEQYLNSYTTALKDRPFRLFYIDAFAGSGSDTLGSREYAEYGEFVVGSAERAIKIEDKPFDRLIFIEKLEERCAGLEKLKEKHNDRDIRILNDDANAALTGLGKNWTGRRGVIFLDPYSTEVKWETIKHIERTKALDTWILFPVGAISRMLPTTRRPSDISDSLDKKLRLIFGDDSYNQLYDQVSQSSMFKVNERDRGVDGIIELYHKKLSDLFGNRLLRKTRSLRNSRNARLFELMFCVGNPSPKAIKAATRIAQHILTKL